MSMPRNQSKPASAWYQLQQRAVQHTNCTMKASFFTDVEHGPGQDGAENCEAVSLLPTSIQERGASREHTCMVVVHAAAVAWGAAHANAAAMSRGSGRQLRPGSSERIGDTTAATRWAVLKENEQKMRKKLPAQACVSAAVRTFFL
eukprot:1161480-Pelagomonas_calceolata.AAC.9